MSLGLEQLVERLCEGLPIALAEADVRAAYLFGSQVRDEATSHSDIDLAVYLGREIATMNELLDLKRRIHGATRLEVDLVVLDDANLRLVHRVLQEGRLVYSSDDSGRVAFEARMRKLSGDFALHAEPFDRALLAAIAAGQR